jgi:hypothetical protein
MKKALQAEGSAGDMCVQQVAQVVSSQVKW